MDSCAATDLPRRNAALQLLRQHDGAALVPRRRHRCMTATYQVLRQPDEAMRAWPSTGMPRCWSLEDGLLRHYEGRMATAARKVPHGDAEALEPLHEVEGRSGAARAEPGPVNLSESDHIPTYPVVLLET